MWNKWIGMLSYLSISWELTSFRYWSYTIKLSVTVVKTSKIIRKHKTNFFVVFLICSSIFSSYLSYCRRIKKIVAMWNHCLKESNNLKLMVSKFNNFPINVYHRNTISFFFCSWIFLMIRGFDFMNFCISQCIWYPLKRSRKYQ